MINLNCGIVELATEELDAAVGGLFDDLFGAVRDATAGAKSPTTHHSRVHGETGLTDYPRPY